MRCKIRKKLAAVLAAGVLFQAVQCTAFDTDTAAEWVQTVAAYFVTDYVNHTLGVQPSFF